MFCPKCRRETIISVVKQI
ncbi:hypothetical protein [Oribacterium asaccharolyticum]